MKRERDEDAWTPYGLEALRQRALRRRRVRSGVIAALIVLTLMGLTSTTEVAPETEIFVDGSEGSSINLELPEPDDGPRQPDARISVDPGRVSRITAGEPAPEEDGPAGAQAPPPRDLGSPVNWFGWLLFLSPVALVATILWTGFRRGPGGTEELNFGVYKGAMPLEMITASHAHLVRSPKGRHGSLFGKTAGDFGLGNAGNKDAHEGRDENREA